MDGALRAARYIPPLYLLPYAIERHSLASCERTSSRAEGSRATVAKRSIVLIRDPIDGPIATSDRANRSPHGSLPATRPGEGGEQAYNLTSRITIRGEECIAVGLDKGNDAAKITLLNDAGKAVSVRLPTAHRLAKTFQGGQGEVTYQLGDDARLWWGSFGEKAAA